MRTINNHIPSLIRNLLGIIIVVFIFSACKKDKDILGANVQDPADILSAKFSDTATLRAHTIKFDSITSYNDGVKFLGSNQDPVFGRTDASIYTKFSLPNNITNVSFGTDANLISAEVILVVKSLDFLGDLLTPLNYQLYEVKSPILSDLPYYSNNNTLHQVNNLLGSFSGTLGILNGAFVVRIPVNNTFAEAILNNPQYLTSTTVMQGIYKGFFITTNNSALNPISSQGVISKFDLDAEMTGLHLYYRNGNASTTKETKTFRFPFNGANVVRFNHVKYNYLDGGSNLLNKQLQGDTAVGSQGLFLKGLGLTKIKITLPYLKNYVSSNKIAVNRAEITFRVDQGLNGSDGKYIAPLKLALLGIDSLNREIFTFDQLNSTDFARYGGDYDSENKQYVFNISRHIQSILNGTRKNLGFYLVVADGNPSYTARRDDRAGRVVIGGTASVLYKPTFRLTFTPFSNN